MEFADDILGFDLTDVKKQKKTKQQQQKSPPPVKEINFV